MKSSIKVSRGGRSITFRGAAARACFEAMSGTELPKVIAAPAKCQSCGTVTESPTTGTTPNRCACGGKSHTI